MSIFSSAGSVPNPMEFLNSISQQAQRGLLTLDQANMVSQAYVQALPRGGSHVFVAASAWATLLDRVVAGHTTFEVALEDWKQWLQTGLMASDTQAASRLARPDFGAGIRPFGGLDPVVAIVTLADRDEKGGAGGLGQLWQADEGSETCIAEFDVEKRARTPLVKKMMICGYNKLRDLTPPKEVWAGHPLRGHQIESKCTITLKNRDHASRVDLKFNGSNPDRVAWATDDQGKKKIYRHSPEEHQIEVYVVGKRGSDPKRPFKDVDETTLEVKLGTLLCGKLPIKVPVPVRRGTTEYEPAGKKLDKKHWENVVHSRAPTPHHIHTDRQGNSFAAGILLDATTSVWRIVSIQILDQWGQPLHGIYETESSRVQACDEVFERIEGKNFGDLSKQRKKSDGFVWMENPLARLNEKGVLKDQVGTELLLTKDLWKFEQPIRYRPPSQESHRMIGDLFDKAKQSYRLRSTNTIYRAWHLSINNQAAIESLGKKLVVYSTMKMRIWGHKLKGFVTRSTKALGPTKPEPRWEVKDE